MRPFKPALFHVLSLSLGGLMLIGGSGCHKSAAVSTAPQTLDEGMADLRAQLVTASADVQHTFYQGVAYNVRYGNLPVALDAMQKIDADSSLTPTQKKTADAVLALLKAKAGDAGAAPAH